jgi:hypothetical protein
MMTEIRKVEPLMDAQEIRGWFDAADCVSDDSMSEWYYTMLPSGKQLWCDCPVTLADVLARLDELEERRAETRSIVVSLLIGAALFALAALLGAILS